MHVGKAHQIHLHILNYIKIQSHFKTIENSLYLNFEIWKD